VKTVGVIFVTVGIAASGFAQNATPADIVRPAIAPAASNPPLTATSSNALTAPTGYVLRSNDQVAVEVFGEDDLRTNTRLNGEGNLSLP